MSTELRWGHDRIPASRRLHSPRGCVDEVDGRRAASCTKTTSTDLRSWSPGFSVSCWNGLPPEGGWSGAAA